MTLEQFKKQTIVLDKNEGDSVRLKYINSFVNTAHPQYQDQIEKKYNFVDGSCYLGYLWDYLRKPTVINRKYIESKKNELENVLVFWDIHSCEKIWIDDYWKFDKDAVLKLKYPILLAGEKYLPEDIYIFDYSFSWTLVLTHEEVHGDNYFLKCGSI